MNARQKSQTPPVIQIVSGGTERFRGRPTARAVQAALDKERRNGRWAYAEVDGYHVLDADLERYLAPKRLDHG